MYTAVEPPVVSVSGTGSRVVRTAYTLTCRVTLPSGVHVESESLINIQWLKSNTSFIPPQEYTVMGAILSI